MLDLSKIEAGKLELRQWAVREAENGREALKRIQENKPDVILLDLMMPEMDGFAVVAALQKEADWRDICRRPICAGQGKIPTGRPSRAHPPARAEKACSQHRMEAAS